MIKNNIVENLRKQIEKFKELSGKRGTREFEEWFLKYTPGSNTSDLKKNKTLKNRESKTRTRKNKKVKMNLLNIF
jgi:hypothetical protein